MEKFSWQGVAMIAVGVLIAAIVYKILDRLVLDKAIKSFEISGSHYEKYESYDDDEDEE